MKIGYARVSTVDQSLDIQIEALQQAGCKRLYKEKLSGARAAHQRPELTHLLDQLRSGDVIIVTKLDRLARSTRELLEIMALIQRADAGLQSLSEPWADTTSHAGKLIMTMFAGIAEFERGLICERTGLGRIAAKARGVRFGRPQKLNSEQKLLALRLLNEGKSAGEVARTFGVHIATVYRLSEPSTASPSLSR